jgi:hypothetical protein
MTSGKDWSALVGRILLAIPSVYAGWSYVEPATFGLEFARQRALNPCEIARGQLGVTPLIADPRQIEERAIRHRTVETAREQTVEDAVGFRVQPQRQVHPAGEQLSFRGMIW